MAVPSFLNGTFGYHVLLAVTDVQTIIDALYTELVTNLGWSCTAGGVGNPNTTYKTPVGPQGEFFTVNLQRAGVSAITTLQIIMTDSYGLVVNNETHQHLFIDAGGTDVYLYMGIGMPYVVIDSERAVPETWWGCQVDRYPDSTYLPVWLCSGGPRTAAEGLTYDEWYYAHIRAHVFPDLVYEAVPLTAWVATHGPSAGSFKNLTASGALLFWPVEYQHEETYYGKIPNALLTDSGQAYKASLTVPIDTGVTGTFRVTGGNLAISMKMCWREA